MATSHPQPMGADRKVLVIGFIAMVVFVAIGVSSAQVFTASACGAIEPATTVVGESSNGGAGLDMLDSANRPLVDAGERIGWRSPNGPTVAGDPRVEGIRVAVLADGRTAVIATSPDAVDIVALSAEGDIEHRASFGGVARVVGDGPTLFVLAHVNDLTGQVDAFAGVDARLAMGGCVDTALVGSPLAFHLMAGDGELVLLRVEEDGDRPEIELRDVAGVRWRAPIDVPVTPPGILAERITAGMNDDMVVVARRVLLDDAAPVLTALDRADGTVRWHRDETDIAAALAVPTPTGAATSLDDPWRARVMSITDTIAVIAYADEDIGTLYWLEVDLATGSLTSMDVVDEH